MPTAVAEGKTGRPKQNEHSNHNHPREVVLRLRYPAAEEVSVIAEFNNWSPKATPMKMNKDGEWEAVLDLPRGKYHYRFIVDNKIKITDPSNTNTEPDGFGGYNSILVVK